MIASLIIMILFLALGGYLLAIVEHWSIYGSWRWAFPLWKGLALLGQESIKPRKNDPTFYEWAPVLFIIAGLMAAMVLPLGPHLLVINLGTGALFVNAALAYIMVAMLMGGWGANGHYSMIAGWRFLAQLIAYSMPIVMALTTTVMRAESLLPVDIVASQQQVWNIIQQPLGFLLFYFAAMALAFLPPFDLPIASELAGGTFAGYTGKRLFIFRAGRLILIVVLALATTVFFLGGWQGPWLPALAWTILKTLLVATSFLMIGKYISRIPHDLLLEWSWKYATPLALLNILWEGIILLI